MVVISSYTVGMRSVDVLQIGSGMYKWHNVFESIMSERNWCVYSQRLLS